MPGRPGDCQMERERAAGNPIQIGTTVGRARTAEYRISHTELT